MAKRIEQFTDFYTGAVSQKEVSIPEFIEIQHALQEAFNVQNFDEAQGYIDAMRAYYPAKQGDIDFAQASLEVRKANAEAQAKHIEAEDLDPYDEYVDESWEQECELERQQNKPEVIDEYLCPTCGEVLGDDFDGVFVICIGCDTPNPFLS